MKLTKEQRAYLKAQKQAFKLHNSIFGCDDSKEVEDKKKDIAFYSKAGEIELVSKSEINKKPFTPYEPDFLVQILTEREKKEGAFKAGNKPYNSDEIEEKFKDFEVKLQKKTYCTHSTLTKEAIEKLTNPDKNERRK